jgi:hypothetical protein
VLFEIYSRPVLTYRQQSDEERKLLGLYFRLWFAVRRTATMEHIIGDEKLDMVPELEDKNCPLYEKVPLPPVMIQQLDMILILGVLLPLQKQVLEEFQKLVLANNPKNWMTVYLVTFMSLQSCARLTDENYKNARKQGLKVSSYVLLTLRHSDEADTRLEEIFISKLHPRKASRRQCLSIALPLPNGIRQPVQTGLAQTPRHTVLSYDR